MNSIDLDWENFLNGSTTEPSPKQKNNVNSEFEQFMNGTYNSTKMDDKMNLSDEFEDIPKCGEIYISTKTQIAYMNCEVDIDKLFWKLPIINYYEPKCGIIKKQVKLTSKEPETTKKIQEYIDNEKHVNVRVLSNINTTNKKGKTKYKYTQKISVGISKKDITSYRTKEKSAFFNCFALIIRMLFEGEYKEVHVKIFNTGKLEIPGITSSILLNKTLNFVTTIMSNIMETNVEIPRDNISTVLINSNFNCGFYINRDKLSHILKTKYKLITMFDPCSYPGIQSKFYFNEIKDVQDGICNCQQACNKKNNNDDVNLNNKCKEISFMIFRTGSILIVGNCDESVLNVIYKFLVNILHDEYSHIQEGKIMNVKKKVTNKKVKKHIVYID